MDKVPVSAFVRVLLFLILLTCGDIESNPGPSNREKQEQGAAPRTIQSKLTDSTFASNSPEGSPVRTQPICTESDAIVHQLKTFIDSKISSLHHSIEERFSELEEKAEKRADELKQGLKGVEKELVEANRRITELEAENMELKKKMDKMESQQDYTNGQLRRNNLIFHGIEQSNNESWEESEKKVRDFVSRELDTVVGETIEIERAHRLTKARNNPQPIVVKFNKYKERERILRESRNLPRESPFKVTEDLPPLVREKRRKLGVFLQAARQDNKRASLRYDKLIIEDDVFVFDQTKEPPQLKKIGNR
ncbi:myosin-J heavy chain-like [Ptychodera flava]|uniref:myosin-J heavy chain-like n=1 Tax=Ptychodera flava TaxID=63121 RepID=UPI00396A7644